MKILMLAYPGMTPLDLMGPLQVFSYWPGAETQLVWKDLEPVPTDTAACIVPTHTFATAEANPDILFVPGGTKATFDLMSDQETLSFLQARAENAKWITSVCTGALVLGAAGLLNGYKATTHWAAVDMLEGLGATHTEGRYVIDRNRATGGGVTAGIDFGLAMVATITGEEAAKQNPVGIRVFTRTTFYLRNTGGSRPGNLAKGCGRILREFIREVRRVRRRNR